MSMVKELDKFIDDYNSKTGNYPTECRLSIDNFKKLVTELAQNFEINESDVPEPLKSKITYRGVNITWGIGLNT